MKLPKNKLSWLVMAVVLLMAAYHMIASQMVLLSTKGHYNLHIGLALLVVFLATLEKSKGKLKRGLLVVAALAAITCWAYIHMFQYDLVLRGTIGIPPDYAIGAILIIISIAAAWIAFGPIIPVIAIIGIVYPFFGGHLPEPFTCQSQSVLDAINWLSTSLVGGVFSRLLPISANYVFLFMVFGGLLSTTGATRFFLEVGRMVGARVRSGPGLSAVVSSALVGSVNGAPAANIAITGAFTIPLMKKVGYEPHQAAAIEAGASVGGGIMPPIMGAAAFIMSGLSGIPYITICGMAIIPALLYFFSCFMYVYLRGERLQLTQHKEQVDIRELLLSAPSFIIPLLIIVVLLVIGKSVGYTAFWAVVAVIVIPLFRGKKRPSLSDYLRGIKEGVISGAGLAAIVATAGCLYSTFTHTGLGLKLSGGIYMWSGGELIAALMIIYAITVLFGMMGLGPACYIIVSIFGVAALMKMGITLGTAHYFILFACYFGFVTPPVAFGAVVASRLAGSSYMRTSIEATKVAAIGFLLPFMFVTVPILLLQPQPPLEAAMGIISAIIAIVALQASFVGYYLRVCNVLERAVAAVVALLLFVFMLTGCHWVVLFAVGVALFALLSLWQWRKRRLTRLREAVTA